MRRCVRSKEYQIGRMSPLSVAGGLAELGLALASPALVGPGSLADRLLSPFRVSALVCARALLNPIAPALNAAAAAPSRERRPMTDCRIVFRVIAASVV